MSKKKVMVVTSVFEVPEHSHPEPSILKQVCKLNPKDPRCKKGRAGTDKK